MGFLFTVHPPSAELRPFVHSYVSFTSVGPEVLVPRGLSEEAECEFPLAAGDPMVDRLIPSACTFLNFNLGDPFALCRADGEVPIKDRAHVIGPVTRPGRLRLPDRVEHFVVSFNPGYAQHFLEVPADELTDRFLALEHFWGASGRTLADRLLEAPTVQERIRLVEAELLRRLSAAPPPDRTVPAITDRILRHQGVTSIDRLSAECGFTRQHLARRFRQQVGVSPKLFCRLVRFQNTLTRVLMTPPDDWVAAALELGYYDQAHLIAEFKEFTGSTPTGFASLR